MLTVNLVIVAAAASTRPRVPGEEKSKDYTLFETTLYRDGLLEPSYLKKYLFDEKFLNLRISSSFSGFSVPAPLGPCDHRNRTARGGRRPRVPGDKKS